MASSLALWQDKGLNPTRNIHPFNCPCVSLCNIYANKDLHVEFCWFYFYWLLDF